MDQPTVTEFKTYFNRDFPFGASSSEVMNSDVSRAQSEALINFNEALFSTQAIYTVCFHYLTAHYLVMNLRASSQGIAGSYSFLEASKSVGSVSTSSQIPQYILDNPLLAMYAKTTYGARYLELVLPLLVGNMFTTEGTTLA